MINEKMYALGVEPSAIRELFAYGLTRKAEIGADKVFDFSLGNPSVPAPERIKQSILRALEDDPVAVHGYTPASGSDAVRKAIADYFSKKHHFPATPERVFMTVGASAAVAISLTAVTNPGDEVIVISPFFPEYRVWIEQVACNVGLVPARADDFQLDVPAIEQAITQKTSAIIICSPNNPVGAVYSYQNLQDLADMLAAQEQKLGRELYLISDEPYRSITYGVDVPWVPEIYARTIVCSSLSKCLSLPGERIGSIYVSDTMNNGEEVSLAVAGAARALGYTCAPALWQRVLVDCLGMQFDVEAYRQNRELLTNGLRELGYEFIEPEGAFYLWVRALEPDAQAFSNRAKQHELLIVPSDSFGVPGWVRISYCVSSETIKNAMPAFAALMAEYQE